MNKARFSTYLHQPELMNEQSLPELRKIVDDYPYFTAGRIMLLRNLHMGNDSDYDLELPLTAIYAGNRAVLYNYVFAQDIAQTKTSTQTPDTPKETPIPTEEMAPNPEKKEEEVKLASATEMVQEESKEVIPETLEDTMPSADLIPLEEEEQKPSEHSVHSFAQWLEIMSHKKTQTAQTPPPAPKNVPKKKNWDLIDNFIQDSPRISHVKGGKGKDTSAANLADQSIAPHEDFMTETLAKIYIKQKHYEKAIQIFKKLSLKYPEKSIYFAGQIKIVEQLLNNKK